MPGSARENDYDVKAFVKTHSIKKVLDVGAGSGTYGKMLGDLVKTIDAVEVWNPYINEFELTSIYNSVRVIDARNIAEAVFAEYDLVIFGDILEHMTADEAKAVWKKASFAKYGLISVPIIHYPQGAEYGNPYEVHVQEHMHPEDIRKDYGPFILDREYEITGTFIKEF
jgi:predicted TPR repeat methyltransferase